MTGDDIATLVVQPTIATGDNNLGSFGPGVHTLLFSPNSVTNVWINFGRPAGINIGLLLEGETRPVILRREDWGSILDMEIHVAPSASGAPLYIMVAKRG